MRASFFSIFATLASLATTQIAASPIIYSNLTIVVESGGSVSIGENAPVQVARLDREVSPFSIPHIKVVAKKPKVDDKEQRGACTQEEFNWIEKAIKDAATAADTAYKVLSKSNIKSSGVKQWLDIVTDTEFEELLEWRFKNVAETYHQKVDKVELIENTLPRQEVPEDAVYFHCLKEGESIALFGTTCNKNEGAEAKTIKGFNKGKYNAVGICDFAITKGTTFEHDRDEYLRIKKANNNDPPTNFPQLWYPGNILLHEAQHEYLVMQWDRLSKADDIIAVDHEYKPEKCANLGYPKAEQNAETWAIVAFLSQVDPGIFAKPKLMEVPYQLLDQVRKSVVGLWEGIEGLSD